MTIEAVRVEHVTTGDKPAVQAEAEGAESLSVEWQGLTIELPASVEDWDPDVLEAFEGGKAVTAIRGVLGSEAYEGLRERFRRAHSRKIVVRDLGQLMEAIAAAYGFEGQGN